MLNEIYTCESCGTEMQLEKDFGIKNRGKKNKRYRVRRFHCELCQISKTIFADGFPDETRYMSYNNKKK
jgi:hypothetical protein